ncbi:ATP-dependent DNA helicase [Natrialbaceae archaeon AArc-T1-2]|uniref:ATP-dependent DNA helicase n=1 Tax=Natrialbaceae archaeon AArc-T1-2 TaxID=3053904 RepID=UPI00255AA3D2|nr:ATP-dependent DNA helicase [Natrialbaceae archaeon AArc-T1-2]WIV68593.1 ATP-dependent DNA helicase [Natrialbaceae archaeon AArc-T1-2]
MGEDEPLEPRGNQPAALESEAACISVDAGAGTGKTTTMLMRIERAIDRDGVDPGDVLVLTFANETAASIREAVRERLGPATAADIDVYTYHSLCHRLVREYAYAIGRSPEFDVVTGRGRRRIVRRLLAENDYEFATTGGDGSVDDLTAEIDHFVRVMSQEGIDPDDLTRRLPDVRTLELLAQFVLRLEQQAEETLSFDNEALRYFDGEAHLETARESLLEYGKLLTICQEKIAEAPEEYRDDPVVADVDRYVAVLQGCVTNVRETLSLAEPTTKHLPRALFCNQITGEATDRLEQTPIGRLGSYVEFLRLARHYTAVYADYRATLEREGIADFDDLVRTATDLLADERFTGEITGRWEQVYCDEFQDTDATQFELVRRLTAGPDRPDLFAIGDKDQSIYGWRGTDREGLDRLADAYDDHESVALELNFRSKQEILDLTNECAYDFDSPKTLREVGRTPGEYDEPEPPLRVGRVASDAIDSSPAQQVATTVSRLLNGELEDVPRRSLSDVAVIVRTNRHARAVADELRERQIPHEVSGSAGSDLSPGIRTVVSYLRVLVEPGADVHLRRVLLYRYRVSRADLARLARPSGSLYEGLLSADLTDESAFADPEALERAREHLTELETVREVYPLGGFVRRFRELTRLEWFTESDERADLERIERFAESYDPDSVLATLTEEFVDALERALTGGRTGYDRGSRSEDCVDVMTVHQAKGLEFDTVLVPYLSDEEWCVERDYTNRARERLLAATIDDDVDSPLCADLAAETVGEEWRVLHVALTRAENHLFLFGSSYDYEGEDDQLGVSTAETCLADPIEWDVAGRRMDLWDRLTESVERVRETYPETVADRTDEIARSADETPGTITYYEGYADRSVEPLESREAIETVHRLGRLLRSETLLPAADAASHVDEVRVPADRSASALSTETTRFPVETLSSATDVPVAVRHSYSAVRTHGECPRKHYLDHVVDAVADPPEDGDDARIVGRLFHAVAEEAFHREYRSRDAWREAADRQLTARDRTDGREAVLACIDRYFEATASGIETPVREWEPLAAELPFSLADVDGIGGEVVGYVDAVRRTPDGEVVVLDYKTTNERVDPDDAVQLRLYLRACRDRFDEAISRAGYVYVGEAGPAVDLFDRDELPAWSSVRERLAAVDDPSFAETEPGDHCRFCAHRSLGCGPDGDDEK